MWMRWTHRTSIHDHKPTIGCWFLVKGVKYQVIGTEWKGDDMSKVLFTDKEGRKRWEITVDEWLARCDAGSILPNIAYDKKS